MTEQEYEIMDEEGDERVWEVEERALIAEMRGCNDTVIGSRVLVAIVDMKKDQGQDLSDF